MNILCPIDFHESSLNGMEYAINFSKDFQAKLSLIHIKTVENDEGKKTSVGNLQKKIDDLNELIQTKHHFKVEKASIRISPSFKYGMKKEVKENKYDLVIMGTNGEDKASQTLFGSNAYNVIRKINVPVLFVPERSIFCHLSHIVYATDYRNKDVESIHKLIRLTHNENTTISVVHVNDKDSESYRSIFDLICTSLKKEYNNPNIKYEQIIHEDVAEGLINFGTEKYADLVVLLTREHSLFRKVLEKSVTKKFSQISRFPVLVYQELDD